jgi:anti-sigma-K factor RskA
MHGTLRITDDTDLLVGEYVLGTLERDERRKLEEIAAREPSVTAAVMIWERRLAPLHELVEPVEAPADIWAHVARQLGDVEQELPKVRGPGFFEVVSELARSQGAETAMELVEKLRRWRMLAFVSSAVAFALAAFVVAIVARPAVLPTAPLIAVLKSQSFAPPFVIALNQEERSLDVRTVPSGTADDRAYEFWLLRGGRDPVPLGKLRTTGKLEPAALKRVDRAALREAEIAVSVEPLGPSAERPSGPFIYRGKFE